MFRPFGSVITFVSLFAVLLAAQKAQDQDSTKSKSPRHFASEGAVKNLRHTDKIRGPLKTSIQLMGNPPQKAGDIFTLRAVLLSQKELTDLNYRWSLPNEVELLSGTQKGTMQDLMQNQPRSVEITLKAKTDADLQIHFTAASQLSNMRFADVAQFNSSQAQTSEPANGLFKTSQEQPDSAQPKKPGKKILF